MRNGCSKNGGVMSVKIENVNVARQINLMTPQRLKQAIPISAEVCRTVAQGREAIRAILDRRDHRLLLVVGPCSIHDAKAAMEYAIKIKELATELEDSLLLVMRVYFEKPRTTVGWKGLINDPHLNDSFAIEDGLHLGRKLLHDIGELGLPVATEALDPILPQYLQDLISWSAIGARTTESQTHREMASGFSSIVGFKNGTDGNLGTALNALKSARSPHAFLGIDNEGQASIIQTKGNPYTHVVLRGGVSGPNYYATTISSCEQQMREAQLHPTIMVDCSHANSAKDPHRQVAVLEDIVQQIAAGNRSIIGLMLESNLHWGQQDMVTDLAQLQYGVSITDPCIDWHTTEEVLRTTREKLRAVLPARLPGDDAPNAYAAGGG